MASASAAANGADRVLDSLVQAGAGTREEGAVASASAEKTSAGAVAPHSAGMTAAASSAALNLATIETALELSQVLGQRPHPNPSFTRFEGGFI